MAESTSEASKKPKKRKIKIRYIVLIAFVALIIFALFEFKIIKIPACHPAIQEEVDWPPEEPGFYEETSHNRLRTLEEGGFSPPGTVSMCNVPGAPAAQVVALVPAEARFLSFEAGQDGWEYQLYRNVDVPETGECVRVQRSSLVDGLIIEADANNADMVWLEPPTTLEDGDTYMLTFGMDTIRGIIVTVGAPE